MATWLGNHVIVAGSSYARIRIETQLAGQSIPGNYSTINYQVYIDFINCDAQLDGGWVQSSAGVHYNNGGRVYNYTGNFSNHTVTMNTGSFNIGADGNGNSSYGMNAHVSVYQSGTTTASGSESLPQIPRNITIAYTSGNINDESNPYIGLNNPAGHGCIAWLELPSLTGGTRYGQQNYSSGTTFVLSTSDRNAIRAAMANTNATTIRYVTYDTSTGATSTSDATISIVNAAPIFTTATYNDSNSTTATITGNDQAIVQNTSIINLEILSTNKATAQKSATMVSYTASINSVPTTFSYSTGTIDQSLGTVNASTNQQITVTATDSRGNTTTIYLPVTIIPYTAPTIYGTGDRADGFGSDTTININADYSALNVGGTDKNSVNTSTGIGYKFWLVGGTEPGSYTDVTTTHSAGHVTVTTPPVVTMDSDKQYNLKLKITDALQTVSYSTRVGYGVSAFRIGTDDLIYNRGMQVLPAEEGWPTGSVLLTWTSSNPDAFLPGVWVATPTASGTILGQTVYGWKRTS